MKTYYFSHDSNARNDDRILILRSELGWEGYGIYWAIIETLRDTDGYYYQKSRLRGLAFSLQVEESFLMKVINDFELFEQDDEKFWSDSLNKRMMLAKTEIKKKSEAGKKGAKVRWQKDAVPITTDTNKNKNKLKLNKNKFVELINEISLSNNFVKSEVDKFIDYWTEPNKSGTKMRFELEKTWDPTRRLKRWMSNNFNTTKKGKVDNQITNWQNARKIIDNG